ncbi:MAG: XRE family transcriptional regulator [Spirochaeta sp.]|jgi:Zn-dependent peptidase ImmA (M78 family)/DNA-binding XRE family transcriptional regulator|nr:XRE family transcriptional regulator [Spirochaeta sp.]
MGVESIPANLLRYRKAKGITQQQIAKDIGISRQAYSAIEAGKSAPKSGTLVSIARALDSSVPDILADPPSFSSLRFRSNKSMPKREQAQRDVLLHDFRRWLDDYSFLENLLEVGSRWRFEGVDSDDPVSAAAQARAAIHVEPDEPIDDIIGLLESAGAKVFAEDFGLSKVFGFSAARADNGPAIAVNTSPDISIERQIFTVAHELGHLVMHEHSYVGMTGDGSDDEEAEANQFGSHFLLPKEAFDQELEESAGLALVDLVLHIKRKFRVSYKTVLFRLVSEYGIDNSLYQRFAVAYGQRYGKNLRGHVEPDALQDPIARHEIEGLSRHDFVESGLSRLVKQAYKQELISASRAAEILQIPLDEMRGLESNWVTVDVGE